MKEKNFLAKLPNNFPVVSADNNCRPATVYFLKEAYNFKGQIGIEVACRFIGQNYAGLIDYGSGNGHALLFAIGKLIGIVPHFVMKINLPESIEDPPSYFFKRKAKDSKLNGYVIKNPLPMKQTEVLKNNAHLATKPVN